MRNYDERTQLRIVLAREKMAWWIELKDLLKWAMEFMSVKRLGQVSLEVCYRVAIFALEITSKYYVIIHLLRS